MMREVDLAHPREEYVDEATQKTMLRKRSVCKTNVGRHDCCSRKKRASELANYGVGTVLYFQFLKYMCCLYFIMALMSIPISVLYYSSNPNIE